MPKAIMDATINAPLLSVAQHTQRRLTARRFGFRTIALLAAAAMVTASAPALGEAAPAAGDTYVYRLSNGFNNEARGQISYRVEKIDAGRIVVAVSANTLPAEMAHTEIYTSDGNSVRRPLINHDRPVEYEFAPVYPAYEFPLEAGKSWSLRVNATNPATGRRNSVRVDANVLGAERIRVPAGEFDTIKIRRIVYAGDWDGFRRETNIMEIDWYAPALGRAVRTETKSEYLDLSRTRCCVRIAGDWNIYELVSVSTRDR